LAKIEEGDALAAKGLAAHALTKYEEALAAEPDNAAARYCRGTQLVLLGRREEARREMLTTLRTAPTAENVRLLTRHELGRLAAQDGDLVEAVRQLSRALRECSYGPDSWSVANDLAAVWRRRGREDIAAAIERWAAVWANR
jgi:Flp pilus assembly protein TadD